jgi:hypothetical protein
MTKKETLTSLSKKDFSDIDENELDEKLISAADTRGELAWQNYSYFSIIKEYTTAHERNYLRKKWLTSPFSSINFTDYLFKYIDVMLESEDEDGELE